MIVASHQIDLIPYPGFWRRVIKADIFDLGGHYDVWRKGKDIYHHRVKIGTDENPKWLTLPVDAHHGDTQNNVKLVPELMPRCWQLIQSTYSKSKNWELYKDFLEDAFVNHPVYMWQLNLHLILWVRDTLGITTPMSISRSTVGMEGKANEKILSQISKYGECTYLSGPAGVQYLDEEDFEKVGVTVTYLDYEGYTVPEGYRTVSILSLLMNFSPAEIVKMIGGTLDGN